MHAVFERIVNYYHYKVESIKNRYPCKIIDVSNITETNKDPTIKYLASSKVNIISATPKEIMDDPLLIEKFHPTDAVKLGFISFGQIILNKNHSLEEAHSLYNKIAENMFEEFND